MAYFSRLRLTFPAFAIISLAILVTACGGGVTSSTNDEVGVVLGTVNQTNSGNGGTGGSTVQGVSNVSLITISGSVGDGPVTGATITIKDANNAFVTSTSSNAQAKFTAHIPANTAFPLILTASGGLDIVSNTPPTFSLVSTVITPGNATANINPYSTLIVKTAQRMSGGMTQENLNAANQNILTVFNAGLDTALVPNPISTPVTEQNVATLLKASETLAETIRRNQNSLKAVIPSISEDSIINSLSADMTDGSLDGLGSEEADPRVSSVSSITFGQVLIETLNNSLKVNNEIATNLLSNAISVTFPTSIQNIDGVPINMGILSNTRTAIAAAILVAPSTVLAQIETTVNTLTPESTSSEIAAVLPTETSSALNEAITQITAADSTLMNIVNNLVGTAYAATTPLQNQTLLNIAAVSASSYDVTRARKPELAIDGNFDSKWTALSMPQWFTADLGAAQSVSHLRMKIYVADAGSNANFSLDVSQDNQIWTTILSNTPLPIVDGWLDTSLTPVTARYIRMRLNSTNASDYTNLSEFELYGQILPATIAAVTASSYDASRARLPELAVDGNLTSKWTALSMPQWLMVDLGSAQLVSGINMDIYVADAGANASYSIDVSSDKLVWTTVVTNSALDTSSGSAQTSFAPATGRYVRVRLNSTNSSDYVNLSEITVYAQALSIFPDTAQDISNIALNLTWQPSSGNILGYKVFFGASADSATTEISDITNTISTSFDPAMPSIQYDSWYTLRLLPGDNACFKLRAYNSDGLSAWSLPICSTIAEAI